MPSGPFKPPKVKLPASPLDPLRNMIRDGRGMIEDAGNDIRTLADELHAGFPGSMANTMLEPEQAPQIVPQAATRTPGTGASKITSEETVVYQKKEIAKELWQLEKHLAQGCRIPDKNGKRIPCDCCQKGTFVSGLAYETIPIAERIGQSSNVFNEIATWCEELDTKVTVSAIESGQYDYKRLSGEASTLRKKLMGTLALSAMTNEPPA